MVVSNQNTLIKTVTLPIIYFCCLVSNLPYFPFCLQSCLVAVVVPEHDYVKKWAEKNNVEGEMDSWCTNEVCSIPCLFSSLVKGLVVRHIGELKQRRPRRQR